MKSRVGLPVLPETTGAVFSDRRKQDVAPVTQQIPKVPLFLITGTGPQGDTRAASFAVAVREGLRAEGASASLLLSRDVGGQLPASKGDLFDPEMPLVSQCDVNTRWAVAVGERVHAHYRPTLGVLITGRSAPTQWGRVTRTYRDQFSVMIADPRENYAVQLAQALARWH